MTRRLLGSTLAGLLLGAGLATTGPAYADEVETDCSQLSGETDPSDTYVTDQPSNPLDAMGVPEATERLAALGKQPGAGVTVAVIDSGIADAAGLPVVAHAAVPGVKAPPNYYHGTAVAGLIAGPARAEADGGPIGIAPGAQLLDVQVYDDPLAEETDAEASPITLQNVLDGLDVVLAQAQALNIKVATIALALPFDDKAIKTRIARLWKLGVIVVAATGNRPTTDGGTFLSEQFGTHRSGEDAKDYVHPADVKRVLAVNASMTGTPEGTDPLSFVLENSATMIAAPTADAVSYSPVGGTCTLASPATSWAAAEVSGVLALLQSYYDESPARAVSRLLNTANGRPDVPNTLVGAGEVQVMEALTRPLQMDEDGVVLGQGEVIEEPQQVSAPAEPPDLLASTRRNAVWWGLIGGGTLLLALVLRPVLARRRRTVSGL